VSIQPYGLLPIILNQAFSDIQNNILVVIKSNVLLMLQLRGAFWNVIFKTNG